MALCAVRPIAGPPTSPGPGVRGPPIVEPLPIALVTALGLVRARVAIFDPTGVGPDATPVGLDATVVGPDATATGLDAAGVGRVASPALPGPRAAAPPSVRGRIGPAERRLAGWTGRPRARALSSERSRSALGVAS